MERNSFSMKVEEYATEKECPYIEAVCSVAANNNIEIDVAAKLLNTVIKQKIEAEAGNTNLLKTKPPKLTYA